MFSQQKLKWASLNYVLDENEQWNLDLWHRNWWKRVFSTYVSYQCNCTAMRKYYPKANDTWSYLKMRLPHQSMNQKKKKGILNFKTMQQHSTHTFLCLKLVEMPSIKTAFTYNVIFYSNLQMKPAVSVVTASFTWNHNSRCTYYRTIKYAFQQANKT